MDFRTGLPAAAIAALFWHQPAAAAACTPASEPIATDRPDVTNSSVVVPVGSLQNENGWDLSRKDGADLVDGANSRWRLGIAPCLEVLVDLPNWQGPVRGAGPSGFGDVTPAVKWQISPLPGKVDLSVTAGAGLPTGARAVAGRGLDPYVQFPWSVELGHGFSITGMETNFFTPDGPVNRYRGEQTLVVERAFGERGFVFVEYVGDFPLAGGPSHLINSGGGVRITPTQQIDFHVGFGLNRNAPDYIFGIGYSFRIDGLFGPR
jgi:hypothetical protein